MVESTRTAPRRYIDLAAQTPTELLQLIGELTVLFGRLEYMILLTLKRKRRLTLDQAQQIYKDHSLGAKVTGKTPCKRAGEMCRDFESPPGLMSCSSDVEGLSELCTEIQELTTERNKLIHGLIATVADEEYLIHKSKVYELNQEMLRDLIYRVVDAILKLNELIPIPGLNVFWVTGYPGLDIDYDKSAFDGRDPIVSPLPDK
jgi:hypothetical protein